MTGAADSATPPPTTTSVTRRYEHLHSGAFFLSLFGLAAARTLLVQPLNVFLVLRRLDLHQGARLSDTLRSSKLVTTALPAFVVGGALSESCSLFSFEAVRDWSTAWWGGTTTDSHEQQHNIVANENAAAAASSSMLADFTAGFLSDGVRQIILTPFAVIATRQVVAAASAGGGGGTTPSSAPLGLIQTARKIWRDGRSAGVRGGGLRSLYAGFGTSMAVGPFWTASWWVLYGALKRSLYERLDPYLIDPAEKEAVGVPWWRCRGDNIAIDTAASICASMIAVMFFNPFLVVRTRLMAAPGQTLRLVFREMWQETSLKRHYGHSAARHHRVTAFASLLFAGTSWAIPQNIVDGIGASLTYEQSRRWAERF